MVIEDIDTDRVEAAVFDLGGVFLAGGVESVQAFGDLHGLSAETWRAMFKDVHLIKDMSFGGELLPCCLSVVYGKVKELDGLYVVRQSHGRRYEQPTMFDWMATPAWFAGYEVTRDVLARELAAQDGISVEAARKIVQEGFRYYVGRGMGLRSQWANGGAQVSDARTLSHT